VPGHVLFRAAAVLVAASTMSLACSLLLHSLPVQV